MPIPKQVVRCFKYIDLQSKNFIDELRNVIKIPNVSSNPDASNHLSILIQWMYTRLKDLGFKLKLNQPDYEKHKGNKPFVIVAILESDPNKKTLLYYCHLDVLKVQKHQWKTDPFELTLINGKLYGRGTSKMKGPLLCFIHAIESYIKLGIDLPINIKIICESMYECRSIGLISTLNEFRTTLLRNIDCILMTDSHWLGLKYPCIIYGTRGVCYFNVTIEGPKYNVNSGEFGGVVREPMQDLISLLESIIDLYGIIQIPHFYDDVVQVTPDEEEVYENIKVDVNEYKNNVGVSRLGHKENMKSVLMHVWRHPWFNLHHIKSSCDDGSFLDIPNKVITRFSLRTVPNQKHEKVSNLVIDFVNKVIKQLKTSNKIEINVEKTLDPWYENNQHWNYQAAGRAIKQVYKEEVSLIREGNGFPILFRIRDAFPKRNILILPLVNCESKAHTEEENISLHCYIEGTKLLASYFHEISICHEPVNTKKYL